MIVTLILVISLSWVTAQSVTVAAAGDIACSSMSDKNYNGGKGNATHCQMKATSDLILERNVDAVLTLGDNQYSRGRLGAYEVSYDATWGRFKDITFPVAGNHEYLTKQGAGYYNYFGERAGNPKKGYYSYDLGNWHLIALNSNCDRVGGCGVTSEQGKWLAQDLQEHPNTCTLAYWHHPRFSSGRHGSDATYSDFWALLYHAGVDLVLAGHDHTYERFAPQDSAGNTDAQGIREFVVGTGGVGFYNMKKPEANSEKLITGEFGVLFLTLESNSYTWSFVSITGETLDSGTGSCS